MLEDNKASIAPKMARQAENYFTMSWYKTYRGQSMILLIISSIIVIFAGVLTRDQDQFITAVIGQFITFLPLSYLIYKGKRWAIIVTQVLWTFVFIRETAAFLAINHPITSTHVQIFGIILLIYYFTMRIFVRTFKVEKLRNKLVYSEEITNNISEEKKIKTSENSGTYHVFNNRNWRVAFLIFLTILISGGLFYWYELRPSRIKHDCAWTEYRVEAQPADPGVTKEEEARSIEEFDLCAKEYQQEMDSLQKNTWDYINLRAARDSACKERLYYREPSPTVPERMEKREATEEEYRFCLRDKGL